jgi:hypothetical protein
MEGLKMISRLYNGAQRNGMDKDVSFDDFNKFDDFIANNIDELKQDIEANRIIKTPINQLTKNDIDYILNFK